MKNGTIRGFVQGVIIGSSTFSGGGHVVENLRVIGGEGVNRRVGVRTYGPGCTVRNTIVSDITASSPTVQSEGIVVHGARSLVINCDIRNVVTTGNTSYSGWGIYFPGSAANSLAVGNRIFKCGVGIHCPTPSVKLRDNITSSDVNEDYDGGIDAGGNE